MNARAVVASFALVFAAVLAAPPDTFTPIGSFAECCSAPVLDDVSVSMLHSKFAEPASLTLLGIGLSLAAVCCRETRERSLVRVGQVTSAPADVFPCLIRARDMSRGCLVIHDVEGEIVLLG